MTERQKRFCEEYLIDLNATQAAIRAGYSPKNADKIGPELLGKTRVSNAIQQAMAARSRRTGISQDRVITELAKIAFVNASDVIDLDQAKVQPGACRDDLACVQSVKVKEGNITEREIKLADKLKALELLGKHLGMFTDKLGIDLQPSEKLSDILAQLGGEGLEE